MTGTTICGNRAPAAARKRVAFRADAAFERPAIYERLDTGWATPSASRPTELGAGGRGHLFCSPGRPSLQATLSAKRYHIRTDTWTTPDGLWRRSSTASLEQPSVCVSHEASTVLAWRCALLNSGPEYVRATVSATGRSGGLGIGFQNGKSRSHVNCSFRLTGRQRRQPYPG